MNVLSADSEAPAKPEESVLTLFPELAGRRLALVGFDSDLAVRFKELLEGAGAFCRVSPAAAFQAESRDCDLVLVWLRATDDEPKTAASTIATVIAVGSAASVGHRHSWIKAAAADCMFFPCTPKEILTRTALALHRKRVRGAQWPESRFRVLLTDDDPSITALLKATLESANLTCRCAAEGPAALEIARQWNPDLVVLDINMPGMDGYQVLAALKVADSNARVLLLTACDQESEVQKGLKLGAEDYLVKPFNPVEVLMRIKRIVTRPA